MKIINQCICGIMISSNGVLACSDGDDGRSDVRAVGAASCAPLAGVGDLLAAYEQAWNETDASARDCLIAQAFEDDPIVNDPNFYTRTRAALSAAVGGFLAANPEAELGLAGQPQVRSSDLLVGWYVAVPGRMISGLDYIEFGASGRFAAIQSYLDPFENGVSIPTVTAYVGALNAGDPVARRSALETVLADNVRYRDADADVSGPSATAALLDEGRAARTSTASIVRLQSHGDPVTHARLELDVDIDGVNTTVMDYLRFDADGAIDGIGRFVEP